MAFKLIAGREQGFSTGHGSSQVSEGNQLLGQLWGAARRKSRRRETVENSASRPQKNDYLLCFRVLRENAVKGL
jgi:hypothetical protein